MCRYIYGFHCEADGDEVFFHFFRFPEIISGVDQEVFPSMSEDEIDSHARDAVITALQAIIAAREDVPVGDDPGVVRASGFVHLPVRESMKLELYKLYKTNCDSIAEFARLLDKPETAARRLLDLRHRSRPNEIEKAIVAFGKRLTHDWSLEAA